MIKTITIYLLFAFANASWNSTEWVEGSRIGAFAFFILVSCIQAIYVFMHNDVKSYDENDKNLLVTFLFY